MLILKFVDAILRILETKNNNSYIFKSQSKGNIVFIILEAEYDILVISEAESTNLSNFRSWRQQFTNFKIPTPNFINFRIFSV